MPKFSKRSQDKLNACHPDLQKIFYEVIRHVDCTILCGHRGEEEQTKAFNDGKSKVEYPNSKHNVFPSMAIDVVFYPIDWNDIERHKEFMEFVKEIAERLDIKIVCGGEWTTLKDYPHFQLA